MACWKVWVLGGGSNAGAGALGVMLVRRIILGRGRVTVAGRASFGRVGIGGAAAFQNSEEALRSL
jgi:hypothetical protein